MDPGDHKNTVVLHPTESIASHLESSAPGFLPLVQSCVCHTLQPAARLQEGKKHIWSFAVKIKYGYRVKHSIFFVPLSMVYKGWIWLKSGRNINVKYKNKPLHLFTNTWDLIPQVHKTHVPSSRWGSMCSKTKPNATAAPIKILHQRTLKVHLVNTVNFICKYCYLFIYLFIFISWRLITLQYCSGFCHALTWISHGFTCVPHPNPPSHLPLHPIPLALPSAPGPSACLMHPTWAVSREQQILVLKFFWFSSLLIKWRKQVTVLVAIWVF